MLRVQCTEHEPSDLSSGQQSRQYTNGNTETITFSSGCRSERPFQGLIRVRCRIAVGIDRPAMRNRLAAMLGGKDFADRAYRGCHIKYEWRGIARNSNGDRVRPDERLRAAMWMNECLTFGHGDTNESLTRLLLTIIPDHTQVAAVPDRHCHDPSLSQRGFCKVERRLRNKCA